MDKQNKYIKTMLKTAKLWGDMSSCNRRKVGAVIAKDHRIVVTGYNGTISGSDNTCEDNVLVCECCKKDIILNKAIFELVDSIVNHGEVTIMCQCGCFNNFKYIDALKDFIKTVTRDDVLHAEENAILYASRLGIPLKDTTLYITDEPCIRCSRMIVQAGIKSVYYINSYHTHDGTLLLKDHGLKVTQIKDV